MHAKCLVLCINHDMQVYPFKYGVYICKMAPLYAMHVYPLLRCKSYMQVRHIMQVMLTCKLNMLCKLCAYASYVYEGMQVVCIVLCKLSLWDYASYEHDVIQVMYMLKCELNVICKYVNAYASIWMPMQVCECLCKLCVCLNACLTCYAIY